MIVGGTTKNYLAVRKTDTKKNKKMNERKIVAAAIKDRKSWERITQVVDPKELAPESALLINLAGKYYARDEKASECDTDVLKSQIEREVMSKALTTVLHEALDHLPEVSPANLVGELVAVKRHSVGLRLASALTAGGSGAPELIEQYQSYVGVADDASASEETQTITGVPVAQLVASHFDPTGLIKIFPKTLNERLDGGARPGHHILVFAATEMGKTLVAINMVAGFLHQKLPVLYVGNEDPAEDILLRLGTRLSGLNKYEIRDNPDRARELIQSRAADLFTIAPLAPGTFAEIGGLVRKFKPRVVILDQLRNLDVKSENRTQALEKAATEARNLGKRHGLVVISLTQAADSASGKRVLARGDVDSSNVGIPGQMDVMLGVGADDDMERNNIRMFSFPKNKLSGNHEPFSVQIDPALSKVIDLAA